MKILRRLLALALLVAILVLGWQFAARNEEPKVQVDFWLGATPAVSLWLAIVVAFGAGAVVAMAVCLFEVARYGLVARRYRKTVARLEAEIHQLRILPLADDEAPLAARGEADGDVAAPPGGPASGRG